MQTNNVITKMFEGKSFENIDGVGGKSKTVTKSTDIFSNLLNQGTKSFDESASSTKNKDDVTKAYECSNESYDRYRYRNSNIESGRLVDDELEQKVEMIEDFVANIVEIVSEELIVTEEDIVEAMQMLGVTVFDLLNPQVLAEFTVALTEVEDAPALLLDSGFQSMLGQIAETEKEFVNQVNMDVDQMQMILSEMEISEQPYVLEDVDQFELPLEETVGINMEGTHEQPMSEAEQESVMNFHATQSQDSKVEKPVENVEYESKTVNDSQGGESIVVSEKQNEFGAGDTKENPADSETLFDDSSEQVETKDLPKTHKENTEHAFTSHLERVTGEHLKVEPIATNKSGDAYISVDTVKVIEQLAERVRVHNFLEGSSIEMQLNPENLGKMYVNISAKQGMIHAQIAATNETVKEALESQVHELRETLQQAGVKVDAIEVTIASHEFERSLEQGQSREEQEAQRQEEMKEKNRRDLNRTAFEDWSEELSEEEALIARIMKENGNTFDYTV